MKDTCLVLEGGAFRGVYSQGVLDYFLEKDLMFGCVIGVSAGSLAAINYISKQKGRSAYININCRKDKRYIDERKLLTRRIVNLDFLFDEAMDIYPFDEETFTESETRFVAVATDCSEGRPVYFEKGKCSDIFEACKASASMPFISKMIEVDGIRCLDGGCSDKVPFRWAINEGYKKIVIIRTRERGYRKGNDLSPFIVQRTYREYPKLQECLMKMNELYNHQCDEMEMLEKYGSIFTIAPSTKVDVDRLESDVEVLKELYQRGYDDAMSCYEELLTYLES